MADNKQTTKTLLKRVDWNNALFQVRHTICWVVLAAGTIAYVVQNAQHFVSKPVTYVVAVGVVGLLIYFGNKK
jgi:hypothetical protein